MYNRLGPNALTRCIYRHTGSSPNQKYWLIFGFNAFHTFISWKSQLSQIILFCVQPLASAGAIRFDSRSTNNTIHKHTIGIVSGQMAFTNGIRRGKKNEKWAYWSLPTVKHIPFFLPNHIYWFINSYSVCVSHLSC